MQQYIRIFLPLTSETKGYEYNTKIPSGRCLLESRSGTGKLILWVQDLKPEALYRVHLLFKDGGGYVGLPLCPLTVKASGKGEARYTFDAANIEGFGMALDECQALIIIAGSDTAAPLCGYRNEILPWRRSFKKLDKTPKIPKISTTAPGIKEMAKKPTEAENIVVEKPVEEVKAEHIKEQDVIEEIEKEETIEEIIIEEEELKEEFINESAIREDLSGEESMYDIPILDSENALTDDFKEEVAMRLEGNTHIQPFQKQSRNVQWVRISIDENLTLPNHICDLLTKSFVENAFRQYSHLILGTTTDDGPKRYYIGVPALYNPKDKIVGFRQFKCSEDKYPKLGDFGYWLIFMS
ncbi:MAG: hypothetical protein FWC91_03180 [Defluviitaleaceae bacterium]|nr:hypothetical protein [Defluviitaleaceae bacterium]